jgi:pimeloyl-ACP methyl ester carboxylesterase
MMRLLRSTIGCASALLAALLFGSAAPLGAQAAPASPAPPAPQVPPGELVGLATHRLWLSCDGQGSPTIFVEVGGGSNGSDWWNAVAELRRDTRVCIYSRAGYPRSDAGPMPRDAGREADEAAALIQIARVERPFLLVAHSLGAMNALVLASRHPDWLAGMVLLDPPPLSWMAGRTFPSIRTSVVASVARMRGTAARLRALSDSAALRGAVATGLERAAALEALASEMEAMFLETPQLVSAIRSLGDLPVTVVAGGRPNPQAYGADAEAFTRAWGDEGRSLAALTTRGNFVLIAESGHNLPVEAADRVLAIVRDALRCARDPSACPAPNAR